MDVHPEAESVLDAAKGSEFLMTIGQGEHLPAVYKHKAILAISKALKERDEARAKLEYVRDETTKELIKNGVIESLRAQVAAMREALERTRFWATDAQPAGYGYGEAMVKISEIATTAISTLKDQSNDH